LVGCVIVIDILFGMFIWFECSVVEFGFEVEIVCVEVEMLLFVDVSFDFVFGYVVFYYILDFECVFVEFCCVLCFGGMVVFCGELLCYGDWIVVLLKCVGYLVVFVW